MGISSNPKTTNFRFIFIGHFEQIVKTLFNNKNRSWINYLKKKSLHDTTKRIQAIGKRQQRDAERETEYDFILKLNLSDLDNEGVGILINSNAPDVMKNFSEHLNKRLSETKEYLENSDTSESDMLSLT
jgi:hypothetical protein